MTLGQYIDKRTADAKELYKKASNNKLIKAILLVGAGVAASEIYHKIKK